jgi:hypothetical protein
MKLISLHRHTTEEQISLRARGSSIECSLFVQQWVMFANRQFNTYSIALLGIQAHCLI